MMPTPLTAKENAFSEIYMIMRSKRFGANYYCPCPPNTSLSKFIQGVKVGGDEAMVANQSYQVVAQYTALMKASTPLTTIVSTS